MKRFVVGVTGASGSACAAAVLRALISHPEVGRVHVVLSRFSLLTLNAELRARARDEAAGLRALLSGPEGPGKSKRARAALRAEVVLHRPGDMAAAISSGSYTTDGMVVVPCSGGTLGAIANGVTSNLVHRAAEVTLKERRPLVLAFRESPVSLVHIENFRRATLAGAIVFPLTPSFYNLPEGIDAIVEQFAGRILDLLRLPHALGKRWGSKR